MKRIIFILTLSLGLITYSHSQNMIIAGQTTGTNIQYTDYIPDSVAIAGDDPDEFKLDLDGNGTDDLYLFVGVKWEDYDEFWTWSTVELLNSNVKILLSADSSYWIKQLHSGDTISENNSWGYNTDTVYYLQKYHEWVMPPPGGQTQQGEWRDWSSGYLGFQLNLPSETLYGWIYMHTKFYEITASESAICGLTIEISEIIDSYNSFELYPNPCSDILTIEPNLDNYKRKRIEIVNLYGKIAMTCDIFGDKTKIYIQHLVPGIYLIRIKEENKVILQSKFMKI